MRTPAFHREIHHVRPVEDTPAKLLEAIGYEQYAKALQEKGCGTMAQLQFVNLDALLSCGVLPVHAAHMFALIQNSLGNPPVLQDTETNDPKPVRVYICAASPPVINTVEPFMLVKSNHVTYPRPMSDSFMRCTVACLSHW